MDGVQALELWVTALGLSEGELSQWGLAWARLLPAIILVPAFGLRAVPVPVRIFFGFAFAGLIAPALEPSPETTGASGVRLAGEIFLGLPLALSASVALWAATMTGGLADDLRGVRRPAPGAVIELGATPLGALLGLFAAIAFLELGGTRELISDLARVSSAPSLENAVRSVVGGIALGLGMAAPLIATVIFVDVARALLSRIAPGGALSTLVASLRSVAVVAAVGLVLDRLAEFIALTTQRP